MTGNRLPTGVGDSLKPREIVNAYLDQDLIVLVERNPDGTRRYIREPASNYCFLKREDVSDELYCMLRDSRNTHEVSWEGDWLRVRWIDYQACKNYCFKLEKEGIQTYEGDVSPLLRYIIDHDIKPAKPRIGFFDIETDSRVWFSRKEEARVLSWALVNESGDVYKSVLKADSDKRERILLEEMWEVFEDYDLIAAWNGDRFDFPVIRARTELHDIRVQWKAKLWLDHLELFRRMNAQSAASGAEKQSFSLDAICKAVLGIGKDPFDASKTWEAWAAGNSHRAGMLSYNVTDAMRLKQLEAETGYIQLLQTLGDVCHTFGDTRGVQPSGWVEGYMHALGRDRGLRFPSRFNRRKTKEKFAGAYVVELSKFSAGILKNVHVADFSALYPSIILSWNMGPDTKIPSPDGVRVDEIADEVERAEHLKFFNASWSLLTNITFDNTKRSVLADAISSMLQLRKEWSEKQAAEPPETEKWHDAKRKSLAYKVAANSFYGVVGSSSSRFFDKQVAESVAQCGVWLIQRTIHAAESQGLRVVYGDTDSVFVSGCDRVRFAEFIEWCNTELYPDLLISVGCSRNHVNLAYEKEFERLIFTQKKRYVGRYAHYKGKEATKDSKPEVKGIEWKRGDALLLTRDLQAEVIDLLVGSVNGGVEDPLVFEEVMMRWRKRVLEDPLTLEQVMYSKRLNKPLNGYVRTMKKDNSAYKLQQPHIEIARKLGERGQDVGEGVKIEYVVVDASAKPKKYVAAMDWDGEIDRKSFWEYCVAPPTARLLEAAFVAHKWKPFLKCPVEQEETT